MTLGDLKYGMAHPVHPFVKEPIHRLTGSFLNRNTKLRGLNGLIGIFLQVVVQMK